MSKTRTLRVLPEFPFWQGRERCEGPNQRCYFIAVVVTVKQGPWGTGGCVSGRVSAQREIYEEMSVRLAEGCPASPPHPPSLPQGLLHPGTDISQHRLASGEPRRCLGGPRCSAESKRTQSFVFRLLGPQSPLVLCVCKYEVRRFFSIPDFISRT